MQCIVIGSHQVQYNGACHVGRPTHNNSMPVIGWKASFLKTKIIDGNETGENIPPVDTECPKQCYPHHHFGMFCTSQAQKLRKFSQ